MKPLYHFTGEAGLKGILKSKEFRLFSSNTVNDPMDRIFGKDCVAHAIMNSKPGSNLYILKDALNKHTKMNSTQKPIEHYIMSFCEKNNPYLWREYAAQETGYALVIDENYLRDSIVKQISGEFEDYLRLWPVVYGQNEDYIEKLSASLSQRFSKMLTHDKDESFNSFILTLLNTICAGFIKCCIWKEECEYRLCYVDRYEQTILDIDPSSKIIASLQYERLFNSLKKLGLSREQRTYCMLPKREDGIPNKRRYYYALSLKEFFNSNLVHFVLYGNKATLSKSEIRTLLNEHGLYDTQIASQNSQIKF